MNEERSIHHMKCYLFRRAQENWHLSSLEVLKIFQENQLFEYIHDCYDVLHLSSYHLALQDLETILKNRGITI